MAYLSVSKLLFVPSKSIDVKKEEKREEKKRSNRKQM